MSILPSILDIAGKKVPDLHIDLFLTVILELDPLTLVSHLFSRTLIGNRITYLLHESDEKIYGSIIRRSFGRKVFFNTSTTHPASDNHLEAYLKLLEERQTFFLVLYLEVYQTTAIYSPQVNQDLFNMITINRGLKIEDINIKKDLRIIEGDNLYDTGLPPCLNFILELLNIIDLDTFREVFRDLPPCIITKTMWERENNTDLVYKHIHSNVMICDDEVYLSSLKAGDSDQFSLSIQTKNHHIYVVNQNLIAQIKNLYGENSSQRQHSVPRDQIIELVKYALTNHHSHTELIVDILLGIRGSNKIKTLVLVIELLFQNNVNVNDLRVTLEIRDIISKGSLLMYACTNQSQTITEKLTTIHHLDTENAGRAILVLIASTADHYSMKANRILALILEKVSLEELMLEWKSKPLITSSLIEILGIKLQLYRLEHKPESYSPQFHQIAKFLVKFIPSDSDTLSRESSSTDSSDDHHH